MKKQRLFKAQFVVPDKVYVGQNKKCTLDNCVLVKDKIAQYWKGRVRPLIFYRLDSKTFDLLVNELRKSKGSLNRSNYKTFLPFMLKKGFTKYEGHGYVALDLEECLRVKKQYEFNRFKR